MFKVKGIINKILEGVDVRTALSEAEGYTPPRNYTQREIKALIRNGNAIDVSDYKFSQMKEFLNTHKISKVGVSGGTYGINGVVVSDTETGDLYASVGRSTATSMLAG